MIDKLYRYEAKRYSVAIDAEMELYGVSGPHLELREYIVVADTPKGYWITFCFGTKDKWVSRTSLKRFAHPTKEEAMEAFIARKKAYVRHSEARLLRAEKDLALVCQETKDRIYGKLGSSLMS